MDKYGKIRILKVLERQANLFTYLFLTERQRQSMSGGGAERERETQNPKQAPGSVRAVSTEPEAGLGLTDHEIMT